MHDHNIDNAHSTGDPMYWILFISSFIMANASGACRWVSDKIGSVNLPTHDYWFLPQPEELVPALIVAVCLAAASFFTNQLLKLAWRKVFPKKN